MIINGILTEVKNHILSAKSKKSDVKNGNGRTASGNPKDKDEKINDLIGDFAMGLN